MYIYIYYAYIYHGVSPLKYGEIFFQKELFMRELLEEIFEEGLLYMGGLMIKSCQGRQSFINAFSNNLNIVNLFPNLVGIFNHDQNNGRIYPWVNS